jgi:positive regulator of sigma E activity
MTNEAIVTKILDKNRAEVLVNRGTACGGNCGSCEACMFDSSLRAEAVNTASALPGQKVIIETKNSKVFKAIFLVYILPFIFFFIGYALAYSLGAAENVCMIVSLIAFALGVALMVISQRLKRERENHNLYEIVRVVDSENDCPTDIAEN